MSIEKMTISDERQKAFEEGKITLKDLTAEETSALENLLKGDEPVDVAPADEAVKVIPDAPVVVTVDHVKYKEKADEANTYKQKSDALNRQLEETRAQLEVLKTQSATKVDNPIKDPNAVWNEKHQMDLAQEVARLKAIVESGVNGSLGKLEKLEKELADQALFASLDSFASEFSELRLARPFKDANAEYITFTQKLGATPEDMSKVDQYFKDPAFRKEQETLGVKPPKDYDRLSAILDVYHKSKGYPNYRSAYLDKMLTPEELEKRLNGRYIKGVDDAVTRIAHNKSETTILDPGHSNEGGFEMTEPQMMAWMQSHPYPTTTQDRQVMDKIQSYIRARSQG